MASGESSNVRVAVRCRPMSSREKAQGCQEIILVEDNQISITDPADTTGSKREPKAFSYDFAYDSTSNQESVHLDLGAPIVEKALQGYNATIFAYGQTGSGKTHTMMGGDTPDGIIPRLNSQLFSEVQGLTTDVTKCLVTVSYLEIYNEVVHDLLNPKKDVTLKIREHPDLGIYVDGLCELVVKSEADVLTLIEQGGAVRKVASTNMNERSSRSHSCFTIKVEKKTTEELGDGVTRETSLNSKLNLVDLAGSERSKKTGATASTWTTPTNLMADVHVGNCRSLLALGNVITALSEGRHGHIPYRDSTLTRLLQESLGGNAQTLMLAAISPADYNYDETLGTYAHRAKSIQNSVKCNEDVNEKVIRELKEEIEKLRQQLLGGAGGVGGGGGGNNEEAAILQATSSTWNHRFQARMDEMLTAQKSSWEEKERLSRQLEEERHNNVNAAIGQVVSEVKAKKMETMKGIKRLQVQKESLSKKQKQAKTDYDKTKSELQADMAQYQKAQTEFDALEPGNPRRDEAEGSMGSLLDSIEEKRAVLLAAKEAAERTRKDARKLDARLTEERAELVASNGLLDQNERLRAAIVAEEREKFQSEKEALVEAAVGEEKRRILEQREEMEKSVDEIREGFNKREAVLEGKIRKLEIDAREFEARTEANKHDREDLENRLAEAEVALDFARAETTEFREKIRARNFEIAAAKTEAGKGGSAKGSGGSSSEEEKRDEEYQMFKALLGAFDEERRRFRARLREQELLMQDAVRDMLYLKGCNDELEFKLKQAADWELDLARN
ncbi:unnamed protein product [Scytosiphon promiscuus]